MAAETGLSSGVVAAFQCHLEPLGAPMGAVAGAKSYKGEKTWPLHVPETISSYLDALGPCT